MDMSKVQMFLNDTWNACPSRAELCPNSQTPARIATYVKDIFKSISFDSIKSSKWTYVVLASTVFLACIYKIYKLREENESLKKDLNVQTASFEKELLIKNQIIEELRLYNTALLFEDKKSRSEFKQMQNMIQEHGRKLRKSLKQKAQKRSLLEAELQSTQERLKSTEERLKNAEAEMARLKQTENGVDP